jgi:hypothetical protein
MKKSIFLFMTLFILSCSSPQKEEYNFATREVTEVENKIMLNELERYINIEMKYLFGGQDTPDTYLKKLDDGKEAGIDCSGLIVNLIRVIW